MSFAGQDQHQTTSVEDGGAALVLSNNTWRRTEQTFEITADTVLEFDFESTAQAEVQGIGFEEFNLITPNRIFKLYGTQGVAWDIQDFQTYSASGVKHYEIPVGQYYTGSAMSLVFVNDYDTSTGIGSNSRYSNVRILGSGTGNQAPTITNPGAQSTNLNASVNLSIAANDPDVGDVLTFSSSSLPPGLTISSGGQVTGTASVLGSFDVTISVNDGNGGSATADFLWSVCDPATGCGVVDFNTLATMPFAGQDQHGTVSIEDGGTALVLSNNTWRRTIQTFEITPNTVLEFDFSSTERAEVQGIGFEEFNLITPNRIFKLFGSQSVAWDIQDYQTYSGTGLLHYVIPVGQYYTGNAMSLVFVNDYDTGTGIGSNSRFSSVRIYEAVPD
jgi:hypothetical protein